MGTCSCCCCCCLTSNNSVTSCERKPCIPTPATNHQGGTAWWLLLCTSTISPESCMHDCTRLLHLITKSWRRTSEGLLHRLTYAGTVPVIDGGKLGTDIAWGASLSRKTVAVTGMVSCQVRIWPMLGDCLWALLCTSVPTNMSFPLVNVVICVYYLWRPKQAKQSH